MSNYFLYKGRRLSPFWYVKSFLHVYLFNLLKNNVNQHVFQVFLIDIFNIAIYRFMNGRPFYIQESPVSTPLSN